MAPRINGSVSTQPSPETTTTTSVETKTPTATPEPAQPKEAKQEPKAAEKNAEGSKQHATEQKSQQDVRGQYLKDQLEAKFKSSGEMPVNEAIQNAMRETGAVYAAPPAPPLYPQEIRDVQQSINQLRTSSGKPMINVTGSQDADTQRAVKEFQKESGIKPATGMIDVATRERLSLETDKQFQSLPDPTKKGIRDYMNTLGQDKAALRSVKDLVIKPEFQGHVSVFDSQGFRSLDKNTKMQVVKDFVNFDKSPLQAHHLKDLLETPGFERISPGSKRAMVDTLRSNPDNKQFVEDFRFVLESPNFDIIPPASQDSLLRTLAQHPGDQQVAVNLRMLTQTNAFQNPEMMGMQQRMFDAFAKNPGGRSTVNNLAQLAQTPGFGNLGRDIQDQALNTVASSDTAYGPATLPNLMTLASAQKFEKLQPDVREFMLSTLAARPDNAALAAALRDLANDPRFQHDARSQRQAIMDLDGRIP